MDFSPGLHVPYPPMPASQQGPIVKYTTVGSIYNPAASLPLQPPARRGRAMKWPPAPASEPSRLLKTPFSMLPPKGLPTATVDGSSSATPFSLHYSPLQQNADRAMSPETSPDPYPVTNNIDGHYNTSSRPSPPAIDGEFFAAMAPLTSTSIAHGSRPDTALRREVEEDTMTDDKLSNFSVKGLTSLASYPNPNQKAAQERLQRARPSLNTVSGTYNTASNYSRQPLGQLTVEQHTNKQIGPLRNNTPSVSTAEDDYQRPTPSESNFPAPKLSKAGVPEPLTAGPPGQRQIRPTSQQSSHMKYMANDMKNEEYARMDSQYSFGTEFRLDAIQTTIGSVQPVDPARLEEPAMLMDEAPGVHKSTRKMFDSLEAEEARFWYNGRLPSDFDCDVQARDVPWFTELLGQHELKQQGSWRLANAAAHFGACSLGGQNRDAGKLQIQGDVTLNHNCEMLDLKKVGSSAGTIFCEQFEKW